MTASGPPIRLLPRVDEQNRFFWTGGEEGELRFLACGDCDRYFHPPSPVCPYCLSRNVTPRAVSGKGTIHSFTINFHPWTGAGDPYVIVLVTIAEQDDVRLTSNLVDCDAERVRIGMPVVVQFEHHDDVWLPLFRPDLEAEQDGLPSKDGSDDLPLRDRAGSR
ncbi:MAG TPA: Zn-ribbon domain-containing OB-fold protein [Acidimicrobiales bacterium]|nr:Zn-ribbon domain-containing OB-fold protein [Acidimicrobiales bacterium]